jgi:hypothetical protein
VAVTPVSFAEALLNAMGFPETPQNVEALTAWQRAEGGNWQNDARFNPFNTTLSEPGAASINSVGVKAYTSWQQGLTATIATLSGSAYAGIRSALSNGSDAQAVANAVASSPWGTEPFSAGLGTSEPQSQITGELPSATQLKGGAGTPDPSSATLTGFNPLSALADLPTTIERGFVLAPVILAAAALAVFGLVRATGIRQKIQPAVDEAKRNATQAAGAAAMAA